jgi:amino acid transporter
MIALAGAIGTGLFLGAGRSIRRTGPLGSLIAYTAVGGLVISVMGCIAELSSLAPVSGAYIRHSDLFVDPALSFAIGWSTFYGSAVSVPAEWTAVAVSKYPAILVSQYERAKTKDGIADRQS